MGKGKLNEESVTLFNPLMLGGNKAVYLPKQTCRF